MPPEPTVALLMVRYEPLVRAEVSRVLRRLPWNVERGDLLSAARVALWRVLASGSRSPRHMRMRIYGAIIDELRAQDWLSRRTRAAMRETRVVSYDEMIDAGYDGAVLIDERALEARQVLRHHLEQLEPRERAIVHGTFFEDLPHAVLAERFRISEARVSQLLTRALARLRTAIGEP